MKLNSQEYKVAFATQHMLKLLSSGKYEIQGGELSVVQIEKIIQAGNESFIFHLNDNTQVDPADVVCNDQEFKYE